MIDNPTVLNNGFASYHPSAVAYRIYFLRRACRVARTNDTDGEKGVAKRDVFSSSRSRLLPVSLSWCWGLSGQMVERPVVARGHLKDHTRQQWLCKASEDSRKDVRQISPCHLYLLFFLLLKAKDQWVLFVVKVWTERLHGAEIMFAAPKSHRCHHKLFIKCLLFFFFKCFNTFFFSAPKTCYELLNIACEESTLGRQKCSLSRELDMH